MKTKFLLPMLAMIVAIGMSFTNLSSNSDPNNDFLYSGEDSWITISEQSCLPGKHTCQVRYGVNGPIMDVYDDRSLSTKKSSTSDEIVVINP